MEPNTSPATSLPQTPVPHMEPVTPNRKPSYGGIVAILIILLGVVIGAFYFWGECIAEEPAHVEEQLNALESQSTSTDPSAIQADLEAQSPDEFEEDLDNAFNELNASLDAPQ